MGGGIVMLPLAMLRLSQVDFHAVCKRYDLDESKTSLHAAERIDRGLDPSTTSIHALECARLGLDPCETSLRDADLASGGR